MKIQEHRKFRKDFRNADLFIKKKVRDSLALFFTDPYHVLLDNHALHGDRAGQRSMNVTGDWRIIFEELSDGRYELVALIELGTHSQLYGKIKK